VKGSMHWGGTIHECSDAPAFNSARVFWLSVLGPVWSSHSATTRAFPLAFFQ